MRMIKRYYSSVGTASKTTATVTKLLQPAYGVQSELDEQNMAMVCTGPKSPMVNTAYVLPAGTAHEAEGHRGVSILLRHSFFKGNKAFSKLSLTRELEMMGATLYARGTRDGIILGSRHPHAHSQQVLDMLGCAVYEWFLPAHEYKQSVLPDCAVESTVNQSNPQRVLEDLAFGVAFRGSGLAHPLYKAPTRGVEQGEEALRHFLEYCQRHGNHGLVSSGMDADELHYLQAEEVAFKGPRTRLPMPSVPARATFHSGEERVEVEGAGRNYLLMAVPLPAAQESAAKGMLVSKALSFLLDPRARIPFGTCNSFISGCSLPSNGGITLRPFHAEYSNGGLIGLIMEAPKSVDLKEAGKTVISFLQNTTASKEQLFMAKERALLDLYATWDSLETRTEYLARLVLAGQYQSLYPESIHTSDIATAYDEVIRKALGEKRLAVVAMGGGLEKLPYRDDLQ